MTLKLSLVLACGGDPAPAEVSAPTSPQAAAAPLTLTDPAALAALPAADAADGTVDKVVARCASCGLGMDGDPAHSSTIGDYEFHSCSASCKDNLEGNADPVVARLAGIGEE